MGKTITCHTLTMSTVIVGMVTMQMYVYTYTGVSKNSRFSALQLYVHKESIVSEVLYGQTFFQHRAFIYCLQYKHPAKALSMVIMLCSYCIVYVLNYLAGAAHNCMQYNLTFSYSYYFHLKLWTEQLQLQLELCAYRLEFEWQNHS